MVRSVVSTLFSGIGILAVLGRFDLRRVDSPCLCCLRNYNPDVNNVPLTRRLRSDRATHHISHQLRLRRDHGTRSSSENRNIGNVWMIKTSFAMKPLPLGGL